MSIPLGPSLLQLVDDAIVVQDACNLSGVVHSFSRAITRLRELFPSEGTDFFNRHPISVMYASKIESLTGSGSMERFSKAYDECKQLAGK